MSRSRTTTPGPYVLEARLARDRLGNPAAYPYTIPAIAALQKLEFHPHITFFVGENGSGKSTLLEAIAVAYGLNAEGGGRNFNFATKNTHSRLHEAVDLVRSAGVPKTDYFLRAESFYNVATLIESLGVDLLPYGCISPHERSHGESFYSLFQYRFLEHGFFLMDEPEAALSPNSPLK
jgi:predicted ATPase